MGVEALPPSKQVELVFRKTGYREVKRTLRVPRPGAEASISTALSMSGDFGSIHLTSEPAGAQVLQNGELLAGVVTPVDVSGSRTEMGTRRRVPASSPRRAR